MRHIARILCASALLSACTAAPEPIDYGDLRVLLGQHGLSDPYNGYAETPLGMMEATWALALRGDEQARVRSFLFYRDEPVWEDDAWTQITAGIDTTLAGTGWARIESPGPEYRRAWERGSQRITMGRVDISRDSTSFWTVVLVD